MQFKPLLFLLLAVFYLPLAGAEKSVSVFVEFATPSLAEQSLSREPGLPSAALNASPEQRRAELLLQQAAMEPGIIAAGGRITGRFVTLVNAVRVLVPESRISELASLPGVKRVQRAHLYRKLLATSVPWVNAPLAWTSAGGFTGQGVRIGIIDSGIDYLHADFGGSGKVSEFTANDSTRIEVGTFPTAKVAGGKDFVGDDYDASGQEGAPTPNPDPDPLDTAENGHGTHVAGIAAGLGVTKAGKAYAGPYSAAVDFTQFKIGPGVAPGAKLYALKIFGKFGSTDADVDAMDWAADPNGDGNTADHLDVVNLSLGSPWGQDDPADVEVAAANRLAQLGCVVVIAAGNEGNTHYIMGSPGVAARAITVASSLDNGITTGSIRVTAPPAIVGGYEAVEGPVTPKLAATGAKMAQVVATVPADACVAAGAALGNAASLSGKIALIDRGSCNFTDKILKAQAAGALGVIVVNNVAGPPTEMGGSVAGITIPGVMISQADGALLRSQLAKGVTVTLSDSLALAHPEYADRLDDFSSRGPDYPSNRLKPDLAAPGSRITSALSGSGTDVVTYDGTSMATPHVAGAAAILKQAHPTWTVEDIKAALMNTTVATRNGQGHAYPESLTGAGRLQVDQAAKTMVIAKADNGAGDISLSFGAYELAAPFSAQRTLRLVNHGNASATFTVNVSNTVVDTGITLTPLSSGITVPANGSATLIVRLDADPAKFSRVRDETSPEEIAGVARPQLPESSGGIWFQGGTVPLHVPWHIIARAASQFTVTTPGFGVPAGNVVSLNLPTRGPTGHNAPLVSLFQLGTTDTAQNYADDRAATDLLAVGAASDFPRQGTIEQTTVYFGLAVAGQWLTPQRSPNNYDIEIDLNNDSLADFTLINGDTGTFEAGDVDAYDFSTGALETLVRNESLSAGNLTEGGRLNLLSPAEHDTAPFQNGVLLHSAPATAIGLTPAKPTFRYRAVTSGTYDDLTSWITFNAAKPIIDPTPYGLDHTPVFDEGTDVKFDLNRGNAGGTTSVKALVLHQHNLSGKHHEVVTLNLSTADTDGDGLPDAWELAHFGDLTFGGADDPDGDGVNNATEFARGSNPFKLRFLTPVTALNPLRWFSPAGRYFTIERTSNLATSFHTLQRHIPTVAGTNTFTDPELAGGQGAFFYRLRAE